jgi:valyl-tRNA synthetase
MTDRPELAASFNPAEIEAPLYQKWLDAGYFTANPASEKPPFAIVIPPPNVTGVLHIGHALDHTLQDILTRMKRMKGFEALWLPGMDHAGIATQNVVEKQRSPRTFTSRSWSRSIRQKGVGVEGRIWRSDPCSNEASW